MVVYIDIKIKIKTSPWYVVTYIHKCLTLYTGALGTNTVMDTLTSLVYPSHLISLTSSK